jgi:Domain of unknown function (DUF4386)
MEPPNSQLLTPNSPSHLHDLTQEGDRFDNIPKNVTIFFGIFIDSIGVNILSAQYLSSQKSLYTTAGWLLVLESLLMFIPIAVLGSAIDWPKSLGDPAAKMLPLLVQNATAVRFGYLVYLGYSILCWVMAMLVIRLLDRGTSGSSWLRIASAIARCLGMIRWLVAMPALATLYTDPSISAATRESFAKRL